MTTEERLELLEKKFKTHRRRTRWILAVLALPMFAWFSCMCFNEINGRAEAQTWRTRENKVVTASQFQLVDSSGRIRGIFGMGREKNGPELVMYDENGINRARMFVYKGLPCISLDGEDGKSRAGMYESGDKAGMFLNDKKGESRILLGALPKGPVLNMKDEAGRVRASLSVPETGPKVMLIDEMGNLRAKMSCEDELSGSELLPELGPNAG